ncbi:MAG TPA: hypothetical protein VFI33_10735, partial [Puia sp.]|nr:hypothetical protein [Puia sp.]
MTENQFDDSIKNKIRDHRSPVPDDMWERIIQKKDKDRKGLLFFFRWLAVLILGVCLGGYFLLNHTKQKPGQANHISSNQHNSTGQNDSSDRNISSDKDRNLNANTPVSSLKKEEERTEESSTAVSQQLPASKNGSYSSDLPPINKKRSFSANKSGESKVNKDDFKSVNDKKTISENTVSEAAVSVAAAKGIQSAPSQKDSRTADTDDSVSKASGAVNEPATIITPVHGKSPVDSTQKNVAKKTQSDTAYNKKWYLDIYASPDWPIDNTNYPRQSYINQQMKLSYTVGLRVNRAFGKHFSGKIGIQFSQLNFALNADTVASDPFTIHLKSFDLPLQAGYSFGTEKTKMTVTAGGIVNLYSFTQDSVINIFKTHTGFSLYLGFNVEKKINQKISVYLEPYYRYRLTSMTISSVE